MEGTQGKTRRPFHETIVDAINMAESSEMTILAELIKATKIPKGHDEIIAAWEKAFEEMNLNWRDNNVPADLLAQKREAEEEAAAKEKAKKEAIY